MNGIVFPSANSFATAAICPAEIFSSAERRGSTFAMFMSVVISCICLSLMKNYSWKSPSCGGPGGQAARSAIAAAIRPTVAASETSGGIA